MPLVPRAVSLARRAAERSLGALVLREVPHGFDALYDIRRRKADVRIILDVGANRGQSAAIFTDVWPDAEIHCIEPFARTFELLVANTSGNPRVHRHHVAFGAAPATPEVVLQKDTDNNSLLDLAPSDGSGVATEVVHVTTLDAFCLEQGIEHVDLLKVDTEGYDLEVLKGARSMLGRGAISFVQVEAGMSRHNSKHVPFAQFQDFLEPFGYALFGVYGQQLEWSGEARLRYSDPVFVSPADQSLPPRPVPVPTARRH